MVLGLIESLGDFIEGMDPAEILSKCYSGSGYSHLSEEEKLIKAHELAVNRAYALFVNFLAYWILLGIINSIMMFYAPPHWLTTISTAVFSIAAFLSFILWIISYLRYRDYSKKLFLLQLNKGKAEVAIKI
ncbi:hypothetical protein [Thermococcus sp. MAR1]|uniref:hypothetical protein n=1 Tax=Thermococcus sp. MAR1 TaxID=1638263 RepID=UPI001438D6AC|nr:hypothetical protein [Thermococcus sp. MAR1]NJE11395.1 hypothetical protein [Thermococcus sp. MAR1]